MRQALCFVPTYKNGVGHSQTQTIYLNTALCPGHTGSWHDHVLVLLLCQCLNLGYISFPFLAYQSPTCLLRHDFFFFLNHLFHEVLSDFAEQNYFLLNLHSLVTLLISFALSFYFLWICVHKALLNHIYLGPNFSGFNFAAVLIPNFLSDVKSFEIQLSICCDIAKVIFSIWVQFLWPRILSTLVNTPCVPLPYCLAFILFCLVL